MSRQQGNIDAIIPHGSIVRPGIVKLAEEYDGTNKTDALTGASVSSTIDGLARVLYPCSFWSFVEKTPPPKFLVRDGTKHDGAMEKFPLMIAHLLDPANAWKNVSEEAWLAQSAEWDNLGGVPFFVYDAAADTLRVPDTRGMVETAAGFSGLVVGGVVKDMIRNITGEYDPGVHGKDYVIRTGSFRPVGNTNIAIEDGVLAQSSGTSFDAAQTVPTGAYNTPRTFGVLGLVYTG